jgi:hypothetical protein
LSENHQELIRRSSSIGASDSIESFVGQKENMMNRRIKSVLLLLVCATVIVTAGCASTAETAATREKTMVVREVRPDGRVVLRKVQIQVPETRNSRPNWQCKVAGVLRAGLAIYANPQLAAVYVADAVN